MQGKGQNLCNDATPAEPQLVIIKKLHANGALILMDIYDDDDNDDDDNDNDYDDGDDDDEKRKYETERSTCGNGDTGAGSFLSVFDRHNIMQRLFVHN